MTPESRLWAGGGLGMTTKSPGHLWSFPLLPGFPIREPPATPARLLSQRNAPWLGSR